MKKIIITLWSLLVLIPVVVLAAPPVTYDVTHLPISNNLYDLGTSSLRWRNIFYVGNLTNTSISDGCASWSSGILTSLGVACGSGSGSGSGTWSTTTSQVSGQFINYPNENDDIVVIGSNASTTAEWWYDPNIFVGYLKGKFGIGTTTPGTALGVSGDGFFTGTVTAKDFISTSTITSNVFPYASSTAITSPSLFSTTLYGINTAGIQFKNHLGQNVALFGAGSSQGVTFTDGVTLSNKNQNSVFFAGAAGLISEDNTNFTFNDTANRLSVPYASTTAITIGSSLLNNVASVLTANSNFDVGSNNISALNFKLLDSGTMTWDENGPNETLLGVDAPNTLTISGGAVSGGTLDFAGLSGGAKTFTFPNQSGTICLVGVTCDGAGAAFPFTTSTTYSTTTSATSTPLWLRGSLYSLFASSTSVFENASTSQLSVSSLFNIGGDSFDELVGDGLDISSGDLIFDCSDVVGTALTCTGEDIGVTANGIGDTQLAFDTGQALTTASSPVFTGLTVSGLTSAIVLTDGSGVFGEYTGIDCTNQFVRDVSALGAGTCATVGAADVSLANLTATDGTLTFSGTYNGSTARTIGLNLGNANSWTALQQFARASTTMFSSYGPSYFGATATSSFSTAGALTLITPLVVSSGGTGLTTFGGTNTLLYTTTADTLASEAALTYNPTTDVLTAVSAALTHATSTGSLTIPVGASVTTPIAGNIAIDTTSGQLRFSDVTGTSRVLEETRDLGFAYATTTWNATTTFRIGPSPAAITVKSAYCETNVGTVGVSLYDGTNRANYIPTASTTIDKYTYTTNNTFTAGESIRVDAGTPASSPRYLSCRFLYTYDSN